VSKPTIVTVTAIVKVKPGLEEQARQVLLNAVAPTRAEPGSLNYDLHQSASEHRLALRRQLSDLLDGPPRLTVWQRVE